MPYVGNSPSFAVQAIEYQDLTGVTGVPAKRGYTLDHSVSGPNDIEVFVNNVRQEPSVAYSASGTSLTMTGDVETTDDFYIVFQGKTVGTGTSSSGGGGFFQGENGEVGHASRKGDIFRVHQAQLDTDVTIAGNENALCAGPLTIASNITVTVNGSMVIA